MNDSKNLILAVVLSALVLLGWTWAANKYFPTANPPSTKVENGQAAAAAAAAGAAVGAGDAQGDCRAVAAALGSTPARRASARRRCTGSINLKGAQIDDLLLVSQRQTIAKNSPPVRLLSPLGAPGAYIASVRLDRARARRPRRSTRCGPPTASTLSPGHPVTLTHADGRRHALPDQDRGRRRLSVHRPAERHQRFGQAAQRSPDRPRQPRGQVARPVDAGPTMSARSACSTARPITTSTGRTSTRARPRRFDNVSGWLGFTDKYWLTALVPAGRR